MKKMGKLLLLAAVLFAAFVLLDVFTDARLNLGLNAVQAAISVAVIVLFGKKEN